MIPAQHVACMGEIRNTDKILVRKIPDGRPMQRHEDNIKIYLKEMEPG